MLQKFSVFNYRNFGSPVVLDLTAAGRYKFNEDCLYHKTVAKALVYGKNGTGKTNLGKAIMNLKGIFSNLKPMAEGYDRNAQINRQTIDFQYHFLFGKDSVIYKYSLNDEFEIVKEALLLNGTTVFKLEDGEFLNADLRLVNTGTLDPAAYTQAAESVQRRIPFVRWLAANTMLPEDNVISRLKEFAENMVYIRTADQLSKYPSFIQQDARRIGKLNAKELQDFLASMGFPCELVTVEEMSGEKKLYFNYPQKIPFYETASSGIKTLAEIYGRLHPVIQQASLVYLDEFDAFFHYEMSEHFFNYLKTNYPQCQIIMTTHNTDLLTNELIRPDTAFILSADHRITSLSNATERELREGHNLEKLYRAGEFADYE